MKRLFLCVTALVAVMALMGVACGQESTGGAIPSEVCAAVEKYVAAIDATRVIKEKAGREESYKQAQATLEGVLKANKRTDLLDGIVAYATYAEAEYSGDSSDPKFPEVVDKKLKQRSTLLNMCSAYTISR